MDTAGDIINGSLRLLGVLAEGEVPSAETSQDALRAMNQMIDSWNTERLSVFSTQDQIFMWPAGQLSRTMGPSGDFVNKIYSSHKKPLKMDGPKAAQIS